MKIDLNAMGYDELMAHGDAVMEAIKKRTFQEGFRAAKQVQRKFSKDEEIAKLLKENENLRNNSLHTLSEKERNEADAFRDEHWGKCKGSIAYLLTGVSMGTAVEVICSKCKTKKDITDISAW